MTNTVTKIRLGQDPSALARAEFSERYRVSFFDPAFRVKLDAIARLEDIAWQAYTEGRKAPVTEKAGSGFADPDYDISTEWLATKKNIEAAQKHQSDKACRSRVLLVCGSARNGGTCPGEMSKRFRLLGLAKEVLQRQTVTWTYLHWDINGAPTYYRSTLPISKRYFFINRGSPVDDILVWPCVTNGLILARAQIVSTSTP